MIEWSQLNARDANKRFWLFSLHVVFDRLSIIEWS